MQIENKTDKTLKCRKIPEHKEKNKFQDEFISTIRALYLSMNFLGLWPRTVSQRWYTLLWYFHSVGFLFELCGPIGGLIVQRHDVQKIIENLGLVIPMTCIFVKWMSFTMRSETVRKLLNSMEEDWINLKKDILMYRSVTDVKLIMTTYSRSARIFFCIYLSGAALALVSFVHDSVDSKNSANNITDFDKILPIPNSWYPVDYNRSINIQILVIAQTFNLTTITLANGCIDSVFVVLTLHYCGQLKILRHFIEGITYDPSSVECCKANVRLMIKRHQVLLRTVERIQESYNFIIVEQLSAGTLTVCFLGYRILVELEKTNPDTTELVKIGFLYATTMQIFFSYCLVGDCLTNEWSLITIFLLLLVMKSMAITMAAYDAPWYNYPRSIRRSFLIVMIRAGKPLEIIGGKLFPTSLESFVVLMKATVSYLSVLRAIRVD